MLQVIALQFTHSVAASFQDALVEADPLLADTLARGSVGCSTDVAVVRELG
jgi:hypothetical protein